jgi:hypothetical protein
LDYIIKNLALFGTDIPISMFRIFQKNLTASICKQSMVELEKIVKKRELTASIRFALIFYLKKGIVKYI